MGERRRSPWLGRVLSRLVAAAFLAETPLAAAQGGSDLDQETARAKGRAIEEIIVTAQKTAQSAQDVPISLNVLVGEEVREAGIFDLRSLEPYVPLVRAEADAYAPTLTLRGFGTYGSPSFESSVGLAVDDVFLTRPVFIVDAFFDLDRIEVLRGPQGTLFGKNSPAGVFHLITAGPTEELSGTIATYVGGLGERRVQAAVGGPITGTLSARLAYLYTDQDAFTHNTFLGREEEVGPQHLGRAKLRWTPTRALELEAGVTGSTTRQTYPALQYFDLEPATRDYLDDFDARIEGDPLNFQNSADFPGFLDLDTYIAQGRATYSLPGLWLFSDLELTAVLARAAYENLMAFELDVSPADLLRFRDDRSYRQDTAELRVSGAAPGLFGFGDSLEFVGGLYIFRGHTPGSTRITAGEDIPSYLATEDALETVTGMNQTIPAGSDVLGEVAGALRLDPGTIEGAVVGDDGLTIRLKQKIESEAIFGQATWHLTPKLSLTGGARATQERRRGNFRETAHGTLRLTQALFSAEEFEARLRRGEGDFSPKASLQYHWSDNFTTFFTWARGFKSGGFNTLFFTAAPKDLEFGPEKAQSFDLGMKARLLGGALRLNATLFHESFDDLQVQVYDGGHFFVFNAAAATSQGIEGDFRWLTPWEPLQISGSLGWMDAAYGKGSRGPAPVFAPNRIQDFENKRLFSAPEFTWALSPALRFPLGQPPVIGPVDLTAALDVLYTGAQQLDVPPDPNEFQAGYTQIHARLGFAGSDGRRWSLVASGKNLTDQGFETLNVNSVVFPGSYISRQGLGRRIGVDFALQF